MFLQNIKLWNFRKYGSYGDIDLDKPNLDLNLIKGLNLIIGENDSGKTAIIDAVKIALKTSSYEWVKVTHDDFFADSGRLRVELTFKELSPVEAKNFTEFLSWEKVENSFKPVLNVIYDISRNEGRIIPADLKAGSDKVGKALPADVRDKLKVTYLRPLRDAQAELTPKKNSRLSQIFQEHEAFKDNKEHMLLKIYKEFNHSITNYFEGKDKDGNVIEFDQNGKILKESIDKSIESFFNESSRTLINTTGADLKKILESLELSLANVINPGLGSLNRLFMASELIHLSKNEWTGLKLGLIEEIEAHLHPQVQLKVIESLQLFESTQLLITTHSPNLASKVPLERLVICKNNNAYPMGAKYTELDQNNYTFLEKFLDVTKSNLFFAKGLILVEGWSEEILIPAIAKKLGFDLIKYEISVINVGNLGFSNYYNIFSRKNGDDMNIPIAIITDCDERPYEEVIKDSKILLTKLDEKEYARRCTSSISNLTDKLKAPARPFVSVEWTLEWCLYKSSILGPEFIKISKEVHSRSDFSNYEETLFEKLKNNSLKKTEIAYRLAKAIEDNEISISLLSMKEDTYTKYIAEAIEYACK